MCIMQAANEFGDVFARLGAKSGKKKKELQLLNCISFFEIFFLRKVTVPRVENFTQYLSWFTLYLSISCAVHHVFVHQSLLIGYDEKVVAKLVYPSFTRVPTSILQNKTVATSTSSWAKQGVLKRGAITVSLRIQHRTAAQHSLHIGTDVTSVVGRNTYGTKIQPENQFSC